MHNIRGFSFRSQNTSSPDVQGYRDPDQEHGEKGKMPLFQFIFWSFWKKHLPVLKQTAEETFLDLGQSQ